MSFKYITIFLLLFISNPALSAWYLGRDNSMQMLDINGASTDSNIAKAMGMVASLDGGKTESIQVCKGVYLTAAHALNGWFYGKHPNKKIEDYIGIHPYPYDFNDFMTVKKVVTPWSKYDQPDYLDYAFIEVKKPKNSKIVGIANTSNKFLLENKSDMDIYLYRSKPTYALILDEHDIHYGKPAYNKLRKDVVSVFKAPHKVKQSCNIYEVGDPNFNSFLGSDCPAEKGTSGSPYIIKINDQPFIVGNHVLGDNKNNNFSYQQIYEKDSGSMFNSSSRFCNDYEKICSKKCENIEGVQFQKNRKYEKLSTINKSFVYQTELKRKLIQKKLKEKGFYKSAIDGIWGKGSKKAINDYSRSLSKENLLNSIYGLEELYSILLSYPNTNKKAFDKNNEPLNK